MSTLPFPSQPTPTTNVVLEMQQDHSQRLSPSSSSSDISLASSNTLVQESGEDPAKHDDSTPLIPSWTALTLSAPGSSSEGEDELDILRKPRKVKAQATRRSDPLSGKRPMAPVPITTPKPPQGMSLYQALSQLSQQPVPNTATTHSSHTPRSEQPSAAPRQGSSSSRKQVFIGVVIPTRHSIHKSPTKTPTRNKDTSDQTTVGNARVPNTTPTTPTPKSCSVDSRAPTPPLRTQRSRKVKEDAIARGITKSMGTWVVDQAVVDASLKTDVAPMQIDASRGGGRRYGATSRHVRFLIPDRVVEAGRGEPMQVDENEKNGRGLTELRYAEFEPPRYEMFLERLEAMFGPGDENRGSGRKPKKEKRVQMRGDITMTNMNKPTSVSSTNTSIFDSRPESPSTEASSVVNEYDIDINAMSLGKRVRPVGGNDVEEQSKKPRGEIADDPIVEYPVADEASAREWAAVLRTLNKGKRTLSREAVKNISNILSCIQKSKHELDDGVLETTELRKNVEQLAQLREVPYYDQHKLVDRAGELIEFWNRR